MNYDFASTILSYVMSMFALEDEIEKKMTNSFWWGKNWGHDRGISWIKWEKLALHKHDKGVSFKCIAAFNLSMTGKQGWQLLSNSNNLLTRLFKDKYFPWVIFCLLTLVTIQMMFGVLNLFCRQNISGVLETDLVSLCGIIIG